MDYITYGPVYQAGINSNRDDKFAAQVKNIDCLLADNKYEEARKEIYDVIHGLYAEYSQKDVRMPELCSKLGDVSYYLGNLNLAEISYIRALDSFILINRRDREYVETLLKLAGLYIETKSFKNGLSTLRKINTSHYHYDIDIVFNLKIDIQFMEAQCYVGQDNMIQTMRTLDGIIESIRSYKYTNFNKYLDIYPKIVSCLSICNKMHEAARYMSEYTKFLSDMIKSSHATFSEFSKSILTNPDRSSDVELFGVVDTAFKDALESFRTATKSVELFKANLKSE